MEGPQIPMQQVPTEVTTATFAAKFRSKRGTCMMGDTSQASKPTDGTQLTDSSIEIFSFL